MSNEERKCFEEWISSPPYEKNIDKWTSDHTKVAWPGTYKDIAVDLAWQAWQERGEQKCQ
jgi:hypothetical protein